MIEIVVGVLLYFAFTGRNLGLAVSVNDYRVVVCLNPTAEKNDVPNNIHTDTPND
jgi:hypothetical protein